MKHIIPLACLISIATGCTALNKMKVGMATNPFEGDAQSIERGQVIYTVHCASCHGSQGKGDGVAGQNLNTKPSDLQVVAREKSVNAVAMNTAYGKNKEMIPFIDTLTMEQVWDVSNYVMSLSSK